MVNELICLLPAAAAALLFGGLYAYKMRKYKKALRRLSGEMDRILHGSGELVLGSYEEGEISILRDEIYEMTVRLREQSETLTEDKEALADSLADISHQIRTPLTTLNLMTARMMREGDDLEQRKRILREMNRMLERIDWLITALLKMSKLDAGVVQLKQEKIPLEALIHKSAEPLLVPMELRDIAFYTESQGCFYGDMEWTCEALGNVLKNCMEHTPAGGEIRITAQENPLYTQIVVGDNGPGIAPEDLPHIFQRFYRGKNASGSGFGVGLALARTIVISQNGTIKAENNPRGGARFTIRFYKGAV